MTKIGIPRALLYYEYYPMWQAFFDELGAEVVVSAPTTEAMLAAGSSRVVADTCLPVKVFIGHVLSLTQSCDYIFIPAIRSVKSRAYNCSKFLGLPDMTRAVVLECPPILDIEIDVNRGKHNLYQAIHRLGRHFTWNPAKVRKASLAAWQAHLNYRQLMSDYGLTPPQAIAKLLGTAYAKPKSQNDSSALPEATVALIGHPYLLYDEYINHRLVPRLEQARTRLLTPEMLTTETLESALSRLVGRDYWTYEAEVVGAGEHYLGNSADGVIGIMAFGCGPDSVMMDMVHRQAARLKATPFMCLTLDEHTAEAGVVTRLEAFLDMIARRKRRNMVCV